MSGFTPGPWSIAPHDEDEERLQVVAQYQLLPNLGGEQAHWIAECDLQEDPEENKANARLIAAAPNLFNAAELSELPQKHWDECGFCGVTSFGPDGCPTYYNLKRDAEIARQAALAKARGDGA